MEVASAKMNAFDVKLHFARFSEVFIADWTKMAATRNEFKTISIGWNFMFLLLFWFDLLLLSKGLLTTFF